MWAQRETTTTRDVVASEIPAGTRFTIPAGTNLQITQSLGGTYTVMVPMGYLARIDGKDADAIGVEPEQKPSEEALSAKSVEELCWDQLRTCYDPEIPVNIVDLGLVYDCRLIQKEGGGTRVEVKMTLTAPGCGMGPAIAHDAQSKILSIDGIDEADVQLVWDPPWNQNMISEAGRMKLGMV